MIGDFDPDVIIDKRDDILNCKRLYMRNEIRDIIWDIDTRRYIKYEIVTWKTMIKMIDEI